MLNQLLQTCRDLQQSQLSKGFLKENLCYI